MYDTLVVGAGPAGNHAARRLAGQNYKVAVLEEHEGVGKSTCCTGIVGTECFARFELSRGAILGEARSAKFISPSGKIVELRRKAVQAYIVDRDIFDSDLARRAKEAGAEYFLGTKVERIEVSGSRVSIETTTCGHRKTFEGRTAVIATGFGCRLPETLGMGKVGDYIAGAQAEVDSPGLEETELYFGQSVAPGFFAWLVPTTPGKALAGLFSRKNPGAHLGTLLQRLYQAGKIRSVDVEFSYGAIPLKPLPRSYCERVLVVGDAAGQVKPTSGGGVYYGLIGADLAAQVLGKALSNGDMSAGMLSQYEQAWAKVMLHELHVGYFARMLYGRLSDGQIDKVFDIVQSNGLHELLLREESSDFDWHSGLVLKGLAHGAVKGTLRAFRNSLPFFGASRG
ncbi:MAG: NAD(P)/FAD-dependent oxidoreductase [Dehalococcoidia bacterium]|nr:NAD(P)/FAD-dependent oxidoreductase [Dehalococcoidia bacterium]